MHFLPKQFFLDAIARKGLNESLEDYSEPVDDARTFSVPEEHRRIMYTARTIVRAVQPTQGLLLLPTTWGVWQSSENRHLYKFMREHCGGGPGGQENLRDNPCHAFSAEEGDLALDYVYLFLLFSWDFFVFAYRESEIAFLSHDGYGIVRSSSDVAKDAIGSLLEDPLHGLSTGQPH